MYVLEGGRIYLVDFLLGVCEERGEVAECIAVEHNLSLFVCTSHYVPYCPQCSSLDKVREVQFLL